MHRSHRRQVLIPHRVEGTTAVLHVALPPPNKPQIGIGINVDLEIHQIPQRRLVQDEDSLDDDRRPRLDPDGLFGTIVDGEVVDRAIYGTPGHQATNVLHQQITLHRIRMVVVDLGALFERKVLQIAVVGVVLDESDVVMTDRLHDRLRDGGLAGA